MCVADNRKMMRDAAISALEKVTAAGGEQGGYNHRMRVFDIVHAV